MAPSSRGLFFETVIHSTHFPNGLRLITRTLPGIRSAALGVWLVNGVRHQQPETNGYAHLLEHLLFKGTRELHGLDLAHRLDGFGGQVNAQTGRELTAFYGLVPSDDVAALLDLFIHMLLTPRFDDADVKTERSVILQEMAYVAADPEQAVEEYAISRAWDAIRWAGRYWEVNRSLKTLSRRRCAVTCRSYYKVTV